MILTKTEPFTKEEIEKLTERFTYYIKTVIDIERKVCSAGMEWHYEGEQVLLEQGSLQSNVWGGGLDLQEKFTMYDAFINIRPSDGNMSNDIQNGSIRIQYDELTKFFFK